MSLPFALPMVIGRNHVAVTARHSQTGRSCYVHTVALKDGRVTQKIDFAEQGATTATGRQRLMTMTPPVMTRGRLVVKTGKGISVYGEK